MPERKPAALSGGQRPTMLALGRAIVRDAKIFLMDEPLSNLDATCCYACQIAKITPSFRNNNLIT